jgi:hypothetical protein
MASQTLFQKYKLRLGRGDVKFGTDALKIALSNTAPVAATDESIGDITQIAGTNGYTTGGATVPSSAISQTGGVATVIGDSVTWTATGGSLPALRYAVLYDSTSGYLIGYWDYGSSVTITVGNTFSVLPSSVATGGALQTIT